MKIIAIQSIDTWQNGCRSLRIMELPITVAVKSAISMLSVNDKLSWIKSRLNNAINIFKFTLNVHKYPNIACGVISLIEH